MDSYFHADVAKAAEKQRLQGIIDMLTEAIDEAVDGCCDIDVDIVIDLRAMVQRQQKLLDN